MKTVLKSSCRALILLLLLGNYSAVCLVTCVSHNHEPDFNFHDNCPACQWQVQSQQDDTYTNVILDALLDPLIFVGHTPIVRSIILTKKDFVINNLSRAPPYFS